MTIIKSSAKKRQHKQRLRRRHTQAKRAIAWLAKVEIKINPDAPQTLEEFEKAYNARTSKLPGVWAWSRHNLTNYDRLLQQSYSQFGIGLIEDDRRFFKQKAIDVCAAYLRRLGHPAVRRTVVPERSTVE